MGTHKSPAAIPSRSAPTALLLELARLCVDATSATPTTAARQPAQTADALLRCVLRACAAQAGALLLATSPVGAPALEPLVAPPPWGTPQRVLALAGLDQAELPALLDGGHPARGDAPPSTFAWCLPLATGGQFPDRTAAEGGPADGAPGCAVVVLTWTSPAAAERAVAAARRWLPTAADPVIAVLGALLLGERASDLEAAATAREAALHAANAARADWQQALDAISDPICVLTPDHQVVRANAAYWALFGREPHDATTPAGHHCFAYVGIGQPGERHQPCADCPMPATLATGHAGFVQHERLVPTGPSGTLERRIYQTWTYPARNADGTVEHVVEILKDVTDHELLRAARGQAEALRAADQLKAELLGTVSHELRNPLAAIKGYAATLQRHERRLPRAERQEFLRAIEDASDRLEAIIDRLLTMSQLETGATTLRLARMDVVHMAQEALDTLQAGLRARGSAPDYHFSLTVANAAGEPVSAAPVLTADPRLLRVVLDNLLENAVKYGSGEGEIAVTVRPTLAMPGSTSAADQSAAAGEPVPMLELSVRDSGPGIPSGHLGRIFDSFHRVDTRLTRDVDGLGLGLAICKRIVEMHAGTIWAESQPGQGSIFHVLLPLERAKLPGKQREEQ